VSTPPLLRVVEREALVYARLWRGLAFSTFVQPALYLAAMGVGLGGLVKAHTGAVDGLSYLDSSRRASSSRPRCNSRQASRCGRCWAARKWMRQFHGVVATPIAPGELYGGFVLWTALRSMLGAAAFLLVASVLGAVPSAWGVLRDTCGRTVRAAFCAVLAAYSIRLDSDLSFPMIMRLGILPPLLVLGDVLSDQPASARAAIVCSVVAAVARRRARAVRDDRTVRRRRDCRACRGARGLHRRGRVLGVRNFARRLSS